jgi:hypothetical protein
VHGGLVCEASGRNVTGGAQRRSLRGALCGAVGAAGGHSSPAATVRFDDISLIIYPRQRPGAPLPTAGHVVDHIARSISDLEATLGRLERAGVKVLRGVHRFGSGTAPGEASGRAEPAQRATRAAIIEGPDLIAIELVERP